MRRGAQPATWRCGLSLRQIIAACQVCALLLAFGLKAAAQEEPSPHSAYRYLFIVDLSRGLADEAEAVKRTVSGLIRNGFDGQIRAGDVCGIWTITDTVNTRHSPPVAWQPELRQTFADHALRFLGAQRWRGYARYDLALAALTNAVHHSPLLTAFIFSAEPFPVPNAPFSASLESFYRSVTAGGRRPEKSFVTVLSSHNGEFVSAEINFAGDPIRVPQSDHAQSAKTVARQGTEGSSATASPSSTDASAIKLEPKPFLPATPLAAITGIAAEKPIIEIDARLAAQAPPKAPDAPPPSAPPDKAPPDEPDLGRPTVEAATDAPPPAAEEREKSSRAPPERTGASLPRPSEAYEPQGILAMLPEFLFTRAGFVVVAGVLVLAAIVLALLVSRPARPDERPSLISQSMDRPED